MSSRAPPARAPAPGEDTIARCTRCRDSHRKCKVTCTRCAQKHCDSCHKISVAAHLKGRPEPCSLSPDFDVISIVADVVSAHAPAPPAPSEPAPPAPAPPAPAPPAPLFFDDDAVPGDLNEGAMYDLLDQPLPRQSPFVPDEIHRVTIIFKGDRWIYRVSLKGPDGERERIDLEPSALALPRYARVLERARRLHENADGAVPIAIARTDWKTLYENLRATPRVEEAQAGKRKRDALEVDLEEERGRTRELEKSIETAGLRIEGLEGSLTATRTELAAAREEIVALNAAQATVDSEMRGWIEGRAAVARRLEAEVDELTKTMRKAAATVAGALEHDVGEIDKFRAFAAVEQAPTPASPQSMANGPLAEEAFGSPVIPF